MRISLGKLVRRYVYGVRLGERKVKAVYYGDKLIWPTLSDTVYSCVLDVAAIEGSLAGAQFFHALEAVRNGGVGLDCYVLMMAGGREYMLSKGFGRYDVAAWDGHATATFGDSGPLASALQVGDEVTLRLVVPESRTTAAASPGQNAGFSEAWETRWLPGASLVYSHTKGQKRVCPWAYGVLTAEPSGMTYVTAPWHNHPGHRRSSSLVHVCQPESWLVPSYADRVFRVHMDVGGSSTITMCYIQFPQFTSTIKMKVAAVTRHE